MGATFHWSMLVTDRHRGHLFIYEAGKKNLFIVFLPHDQRVVPGAAVFHLVDCDEDSFLALKLSR